METSLPSPPHAIAEDGFFRADDDELGERVQQMDDSGVTLASERGLRFYGEHVLQHPQVRPILESAFERSAFGVYRYFGPAPAVYAFGSDPRSSLETLIVMLWGKGSQVCFWPGSHRHWLDPAAAANGLLEVPRARLRHLDIEAEEQVLDHGGFTIHDARLAFHIRRGVAIVCAFGTNEAVETWRPMELPKSLESIIHEKANLMRNIELILVA